ncbi:G-D-S-L family lipolytic protein [Polaribacter sp. Z014]|uniref:G-D-S-L family lipolytic protein n=1 Tax=Polaribacter sp. Z014 TaxID=2927126 RepID=UPI0020214CCE|nr:G-D-S-L family lipolytic protein [Polaribacter sp. Z014]MCL7762061.1 G-D-S-L family lipolytic protein [Polaribacter sp. Z014]
MKNYKYIGLFLLTLGFTSCDVNNELDKIEADVVPEVQLNVNGLDLSKYVSLGASFTAGYTDGALFKAAQENSFPNILATKFKAAGGGDFNQPLMNDNTGGMIIPIPGIDDLSYRLIFNGATPERLNEFLTGLGAPVPTITTNAGESLAADGSIFTNVGVPGAKSTHIDYNGYASLNPYFGRMANSPSVSMLEYAIAQNPTFFTLSEIGGNDVLGYATSGGDGTDPITPIATFNFVFNDMVNQLTAVCPEGVITNVPYITDLPHFTTVPFNPLDPNDKDTGAALKAQIPTLNTVYGGINRVFTALGETDRIIEFSLENTNPVVIKDESLTDVSAQITGGLLSSSTFVPFVEQFGLTKEAAPLVASLFGQYYGQARPATAKDLIVLSSSGIIGKVNTTSLQFLMSKGLPQALAGQFSAEGVTLPLADKWVLTPEEQLEIKTATDGYNVTIASVASAKGLAFVDLNAILNEASTSGVLFDNYTMTSNLVTGGLISLDGIHLTTRGYALMANKILAAIDTQYGSNFTIATNGLAKAGEYPTNYSPSLQ